MDSYLRLDRDLGRIFDAIDAAGPGMDKTLVFVTGTPLTRRQRRDDEKWAIPYGEFSSRKAVSLLNMYLMAIHGNGEWVSGYHDSQLFLNHKLIKDRGKDLEEIRTAAARFLERMSGVSHAWTIDEVLSRQASERPEAFRRNTVPETARDCSGMAGNRRRFRHGSSPHGHPRSRLHRPGVHPGSAGRPPQN